ncbi:hypothetical protein CDAR_27211 [Caerostris darwini]|uniref:Uncharacterized protein n=1 Tax=Caerostris darwini TaxID=1538125 RepID=A0AAV4TH83_9ARAC|nr:hypothetical protein CDAR_27211 [Caerostris darwini]
MLTCADCETDGGFALFPSDLEVRTYFFTRVRLHPSALSNYHVCNVVAMRSLYLEVHMRDQARHLGFSITASTKSVCDTLSYCINQLCSPHLNFFKKVDGFMLLATTGVHTSYLENSRPPGLWAEPGASRAAHALSTLVRAPGSYEEVCHLLSSYSTAGPNLANSRSLLMFIPGTGCLSPVTYVIGFIFQKASNIHTLFPNYGQWLEETLPVNSTLLAIEDRILSALSNSYFHPVSSCPS